MGVLVKNRPDTPESIKEHASDYKNRAWEDYDFDELGHWVHLLAKRACHRSDKERCRKDLTDAQNYLNIMQANLDYQKRQLLGE